MIQVHKFEVNPLGENCYIVWDDSCEGIIIDCGAWGEQEEEQIARFVADNGIQLRYALQTHMHFDHVLGLDFVHRTYGLSPLCHASEQRIYEFAPVMAREWFQMQMAEPIVPVAGYLADGQALTFGHTTLRVLHTPGHSPGSLSFYLPDDHLLFSGDTLFCGSVGRTDLPGGSMQQMTESLRTKVLTLPSEVVVYPGHGPSTTIGDERLYNPYL